MKKLHLSILLLITLIFLASCSTDGKVKEIKLQKYDTQISLAKGEEYTFYLELDVKGEFSPELVKVNNSKENSVKIEFSELEMGKYAFYKLTAQNEGTALISFSSDDCKNPPQQMCVSVTEKRTDKTNNNENGKTEEFSQEEKDYVLNTSSKRIHLPDCQSAVTMKEKNRKEYHGSISQLVSDGYKRCANCNP